MRPLDLALIGLGGVVLAVSASGAPNWTVPEATPEPGRVTSVAQEATHVGRVLQTARSADPLACALMLRSFEFGMWSGSGARVRLPGDPAALVRDTYDWTVSERPGPESLPALQASLASANTCEQRMAAVLMGRARDASVRAAARSQLRSSSEQARIGAVLAVGYAEDVQALEGLDRAANDGSLELRLAAIWAMGRIESPSSIDAVTRHLSDSEADIRLNAAWALGKIEHPDAIPALVERLRLDNDPGVRQMIAWALGQIE